jgi:predicted nucleotidyltransferase
VDELAAAVPAALERDPAVRSARLVGSRANGTARPLSDWDFAVDGNYAAVAERLPELVAPLEPLGALWDPLGTVRTYMLMLPSGEKVDLIFDEPQEESPPWTVRPETRPRIDHHFWDWSLWLAGKQAAAKKDLVVSELERMHRHLLEPLGVSQHPETLDEAIDAYLAVRGEPSEIERAVLPRLRDGA